MQRRFGERAGDLRGQADVLHDEAIGSGAVSLAHAFQGLPYLVGQDDGVHGDVDGNPAQMREVAGLPQRLQGEVVGPAPRIEGLKPQIHRIGPASHRRMQRRHIAGRRQQFYVSHSLSPHHRFAQGSQRGPERCLHLC